MSTPIVELDHEGGLRALVDDEGQFSITKTVGVVLDEAEARWLQAVALPALLTAEIPSEQDGKMESEQLSIEPKEAS